MQARRHTQKTAGDRARMDQKARESFMKAASCAEPKNMKRENTRPRPKNSQMDVLKIFRFSFSRPRAWASLVSLEMASGSPAVEMVKSRL